MPVPILEIEIIQIIDLETLHTIDIEIIPTIGIETIQTIETPIQTIKIIEHAIILTTNQNITIIKIDHATIHRSSSYNIRQRNYSQLTHRNKTR